MISGVRCLACRVGSLSFGLRLLLRAPVGLVPGLVASETNDCRSLSISFLHQRLVVVFTILGLLFLISVVGELVASFTDVPARLDWAKAETVPWWEWWYTSGLLKNPVARLVIGLSLLLAVAILPC